MKKIYTLLGAMAISTMATSAFAAGGLGEAVVTIPDHGMFTTDFPTLFEMHWEMNGEPVEVTFTNPDAPVIRVTVNGETEDAFASYGVSYEWEGDNSIEVPDHSYITIDLYDLIYNVMDAPQYGAISLDIPAGFVTANGETNAAQTLGYEVFQAVGYDDQIFSPATNRVYPPSMLKTVSVTFPERVTPFQSNQEILINYSEPYTGQVTIEGNSITLDLSTLEPGKEYTVAIPAMYVKVGENRVNGEVYITYDVQNSLPSAEVYYGPADNSLLAAGNIPPVYLTWDFQTITPTAEGLSAIVRIQDGEEDEGGWKDFNDYDLPASAFSFATVQGPSEGEGGISPQADMQEGNVLIIDFGSIIPSTYTGDVALEIPAGIVENTTYGVNPGDVYSYTINELLNVTPDFLVDDNIISVLWEGYTANSPYKQPYIQNSNGERIYLLYDPWGYGNGQVNNDWSTGALTVDVTSLNLPNGNYTLVIPDNAQQVTDEDTATTYLVPEASYEFGMENGQIVDATEPAPEVTYLSDATVTSGLIGGYMCNQWGISDLSLEYLNNGEAETITLVNPMIEYEEGDEDMEYPIYYRTAQLTDQEGNSFPVKLTIPSGGGMIMDEEEGDATAAYTGTSLNVDLLGVEEGYAWPVGKYTLEIPENVVVCTDGDVNPAQTIEWTMVGEYAPITDAMVSPRPRDLSEGENGTYSQAELEAVTITFAEEISYLAGDITCSTGNGESAVLSSDCITIEGKVLTLDLSDLAQGTYNIVIPTGYLLVGGNKLSGEKYMSYVVWNGLPEATMIQGPAPVGVYAQNIELTWGEAIESVGQLPALNVYENWYDPSATPAFQIPALNLSLQTVSYGEEGGTPEKMYVLYIDIEEIFMGLTGNYIIVVPEGIVTANGLVNPQQEIAFTLTQLVADPEITLSEYGEVTMVWEDATYIGYNENLAPYLETPSNGRVYITWEDWATGQGEISLLNSYDGILVNLSTLLTEAGDYTLVIPQGYLTISYEDASLNGINGEIVYQFTYEDGQTSGINAIESNVKAAAKGIFTLQGVKVGNNAADINNLPAGLYIIDGKKVMIRK